MGSEGNVIEKSQLSLSSTFQQVHSWFLFPVCLTGCICSLLPPKKPAEKVDKSCQGEFLHC